MKTPNLNFLNSQLSMGITLIALGSLVSACDQNYNLEQAIKSSKQYSSLIGPKSAPDPGATPAPVSTTKAPDMVPSSNPDMASNGNPFPMPNMSGTPGMDSGSVGKPGSSGSPGKPGVPGPSGMQGLPGMSGGSFPGMPGIPGMNGGSHAGMPGMNGGSQGNAPGGMSGSDQPNPNATGGPVSDPIPAARATCAQLIKDIQPLKSAGLASHDPRDYTFAGDMQILDSQVGSINGVASQVDVDAKSVVSVSLATDKLVLNAETLGHLDGAIQDIKLVVGSIDTLVLSGGQVAVVARSVSGVKPHIKEIEAVAGDILVCGFDVDRITAAAGSVIVIGGSVKNLEGVFENVQVPDGTSFTGVTGSFSNSH